MELARAEYSRKLKLAAMHAMDAGETYAQVAKRVAVSPKLLEKWRGEWRARGEAAFPGRGKGSGRPVTDERRLAELERKVGQLTLENDFLKKALAHFRERHPPAVVSGEAVCATNSKKRPKREAV